MKINVNYLKAAALVTSKEETRYYLKGVAIQASDKGVFIVATDGHRLTAFRQAETYDGEPINIIIPIETVIALKTKEETVELNGNILGNIIFMPIDGTFPDWRRIVPKELNNQTAQFNLTYLGDFAKVAKALGKGTPACVNHNGDLAALISFGPDVDGFGLLMPMRLKFTGMNDLPPSWAL